MCFCNLFKNNLNNKISCGWVISLCGRKRLLTILAWLHTLNSRYYAGAVCVACLYAMTTHRLCVKLKYNLTANGTDIMLLPSYSNTKLFEIQQSSGLFENNVFVILDTIVTYCRYLLIIRSCILKHSIYWMQSKM